MSPRFYSRDHWGEELDLHRVHEDGNKSGNPVAPEPSSVSPACP